MPESIDITPILTALDIESPSIIREQGDRENAIAVDTENNRIIIQFGRFDESVGVYLTDEKVDLFSKSERVVPIEYAVDLSGQWHDELFEDKFSIVEKIDIFSKILKSHLTVYLNNKSKFEELVIFNMGFRSGYTYANME